MWYHLGRREGHEQMPRKRESEQPEFMRVSEAAALLGISNRTMTRMLTDGSLEVVGLDPMDHRAKLVRRADVEAILRLTARPQKSPAA
jgi:excisionase family DNA binding protein